MTRQLLCLGFSLWTAAAHASWDALQLQLEALQRRHNVPAVGLIILDERQPVVIHSAGDWNPDTPFRWGSISKSFTALGALRLQEQGKLQLDNPVRRYLPDGVFDNPWQATQPLTVAHLVELSAGLTDLTGAEWNNNTTLPLSRTLTRQVRPLRWPPGLQHSYSNVPPGLTAGVIEAVSGETFNQFMQQAVLRPLNMPRASFDPVAGLPGGFKADGATEIPYWNMTFTAFGGLNASLREMAGFLEMLLNAGQLGGRQVFVAESIQRMFTPTSQLAARAGLEVGYGAGLYGSVANGHVFWGHGGDADGYRARYGVLPRAGRGYLVAINTDNPQLLGRMRRLIEAALTADLPRPDDPVAPATVETLSRYSGRYYPSSTRFDSSRWADGELPTARISHTSKELVFTRGKRKTRLLPVAQGRFRRPDDPAVTVVFIEDAAGVLYLQGELGNFVNISRPACPGFLPRCLQ